MGKTEVSGTIEALKTFTDVVYLSDKPNLPPEIRRLLRQRKLSYCMLPLEGYMHIRQRSDLIGTVVVDTEGTDISEDKQLARTLELLERDNIGVILLTCRVRRPVRSFSLVSSESSFSMTNAVESISLDDLWAQISVNLAPRKNRESGIAVKPVASTSSSERLWRSKQGDESAASGAYVDNLTEQLRLAGMVQRDFLPPSLPNSEETQWAVTFQPAEWVSGDIYDVARVDEQHVGFYVADAVGHSMPAALLTIFIKQALTMRETIDNRYRILSPCETVSNLNDRMTGQRLSGYQFATCCYALLNIKTRQLTFARAGHPYPILLRPRQMPQQLETRGSLLGVFENAEFVQRTVQLEPGDRFLLYSDGAEALIGSLNDEKGFLFTESFLTLKDLPVTEMIDQLTEQAKNRQIEPCDVDDLTIVGLQVQ